MPSVSDRLVRAVAVWEGYRADSYWDVDHYSHGYGTRSSQGAPPISEPAARAELQQGLNEVVGHIPRVKRLKQQEVDALASFGYNLGIQALVDTNYSTLAKRLKSKEGRRFEDRRDIYHDELRKWCMPGSIYERGLLARRMAETKIARLGDYP
jgi:GH24 family phage-related lysozyme (muramidase)